MFVCICLQCLPSVHDEFFLRRRPQNAISLYWRTPTDASVNTLTDWGVGGRQLILKYSGDQEAKRARHQLDRPKHPSDWIFIWFGDRTFPPLANGGKESFRLATQKTGIESLIGKDSFPSTRSQESHFLRAEAL
ncbi:hypothetical protein CDAR_62201 [Caerostris darwini]|uniref:Uncharacterized protein n=1 Tax=Caerostris darwini TaxID=1538125 RepID=A0AAV4MWB3_9ARAC|nr:hypothetical protein CDAR_62201 [Caerostris darwini]